MASGGEHQLLRAPDVFRQRVQAKGTGDRVGKRRGAGGRWCRRWLDDPPGEALLVGGPFREEGHIHPLLVGCRQPAHGPLGQGDEAACVPSVQVAAGVPLTVEGDRPLDRDAAPVRDLDAEAEGREVETLRDTGDQVASRVPLPEGLDPEGQGGDPARKGQRQEVVGVQVAEPDEDADHLIVEAVVGEPLQPVVEQVQPLHRVDGVHGPLERQMCEELLDEDVRLLYDLAPLVESEGLRGGQQIGQTGR